MKALNKLSLSVVVSCVMFSPLVIADGFDPVALKTSTEYSLEIDKSSRQLLVRQGTYVAKQFTVALGRGGLGDKRIRGDNKTPIGVYHITGFDEQSPFDIFMRLSYPNVKDGFFGLQRSLIERHDFDRIIDAERQDAMPPQDTPLGGAIGIHGLGDENPEKLHIHAKLDWTKGCIALTNREIRELRKFVSVGTKVVIRE